MNSDFPKVSTYQSLSVFSLIQHGSNVLLFLNRGRYFGNDFLKVALSHQRPFFRGLIISENKHPDTP